MRLRQYYAYAQAVSYGRYRLSSALA